MLRQVAHILITQMWIVSCHIFNCIV